MRLKKRVPIRLSDDEYETLVNNARNCNLSMSTYIRMLMKGKMPKEAPPMQYYYMTRELRDIGNNLNQIAHVANATDLIDSDTYRAIVIELEKKIEEIDRVVLMLEKISINPK